MTTYDMMKGIDFNKVDIATFKPKSVNLSELSTL